MHRSVRTLCFVAAALVVSVGHMSAQGFAVNEHGTCQMARGGTGVAMPCPDGSAMFANPAGLVGRTGWTISAGATLIDARGNFTDDLTATTTDLDNSPIPVPHLYAVYGASEQVALGVGVFVPYGLGTQWPVTFEGRFNGYDNSLQSIYIQPSVAFKPHPMISIGAGFDVVMGRVELTQRVDLSEFPVPGQGGATFGALGVPFHTDAADVFLEGTGTGFGGHVGIIIEPSDMFSIGVKYLSRVSIDYTGDVAFDSAASLVLPPGNPLATALGLPSTSPLPLATVLAAQFQTGGAFADQGVETAITMPDQITAGVAISPTPDFTFLVDYQYINWTVFDTLPIDFASTATPDRAVVEDYEATHAVRTGFDWATSDKLTLRAGYIYHTAAAPPQTVTPLLPEGKRSEFTVGFGFAFSETLRTDAAYQYIAQQDRRGRVREAPAGQPITEALNSGLYEFFAHLVGLTLTVSF